MVKVIVYLRFDYRFRYIYSKEIGWYLFWVGV